MTCEPGGESSQTVLLAEEHPQLRKMMQRVLVRAGFSVLTAPTPGAALEIEAGFTGEIALMITGSYPRDGAGREQPEVLEGRRKGLPLMLVSGEPDTQQEAARYGWFFVAKPFVPAAFLSAVKVAIKR